MSNCEGTMEEVLFAARAMGKVDCVTLRERWEWEEGEMDGGRGERESVRAGAREKFLFERESAGAKEMCLFLV